MERSEAWAGTGPIMTCPADQAERTEEDWGTANEIHEYSVRSLPKTHLRRTFKCSCGTNTDSGWHLRVPGGG